MLPLKSFRVRAGAVRSKKMSGCQNLPRTLALYFPRLLQPRVHVFLWRGYQWTEMHASNMTLLRSPIFSLKMRPSSSSVEEHGTR